MELRVRKEGSALVPFDMGSSDFIDEQSDGKFFICELTSPRNAKYIRKFFKLLSVAYPYWEPKSIVSDIEAVKDFEQFREDVTILAGFYERVFSIDGSMKVRSKSISFAKMKSDEEFNKVYNRVADVIIKHVLKGWTIEEVDNLVGGFL